MKKRLCKFTSMVLAVMLLLSCFAPMTLAAEKTEDEVGASSYTVYFDDQASLYNYGNIYCYMWNESTTGANAEWPGKKMSYDNSTGYYYYNSTVKYERCIFSVGDGNPNYDYEQTYDLDACYGYVYICDDVGASSRRLKGAWKEYNSDPYVDIGSYTIYMKNSANWSYSGNTMYLYAWNDSGSVIGVWPGIKMTSLGNGIYRYKTTTRYDNCIFTDGGGEGYGRQSPNMTARYGYIYDNASYSWEMYETPPTTAPVTTVKPTVPPTTVPPTTVAPTTVVPTTVAPTTEPAPKYVNIVGDIVLGLADNGTGFYTGTVELEKGSYAYKVDECGTEMGFGYSFTDSMTGVTYSPNYKTATTLNATGGYYTFKYNINTNKLTVSHVPYQTEEVKEPVDDENRYCPSEGVETNRYYFYMPGDWYNEYADTANIYWWLGTDACSKWTGYNSYMGDVANIYYCDVPQDVTTIIWNNGLDGGEDATSDKYLKAFQTVGIGSEYYDAGESPLYPNGTDNFDNMIYVLDPNKVEISEFSGKKVYGGEWYYYYGNGEYGVYPTRAEAVANGALYNTEYQPPKETVEPTEAPTTVPVTEPTEPITTVPVTEPTEPITTVPVTEPTEPITTAPVTEPITTEPITEPVKDELTVNATSNLFTSQTATYNNRTRELTVTYYIDSEKDMLNTQWELTYDPTVLTVSEDKNTADTVCPEFTTGRVFTINEGVIKFNTYNLSLYDISSEEKVFARVVFDVNDFKALGIDETTINLNVQHLTLSALDSSSGISDMNEEVRVVYNSVYDDSYGLINTARIEFDSTEIPEYIGDADGSGDINIHDATLIAKYLADYAVLDEGQLLVSDCDGDGVVTIKDVTCIQLYIADAVNYGNTGQKYA